MLIHFTPRLHLPIPSHACDLVSVSVEELGVELDGRDLKAGQPYADRHLWAGSLRHERRAVAGLLLDAPGHVARFTVTSRWAINSTLLLKHVVRYEVTDDELDCVSDNTLLWHGDQRRYARRMTDGAGAGSPCEPRMDLLLPRAGDAPRLGQSIDTVDSQGLLSERREVFRLPTIERDRLVNSRVFDRRPSPETVLRLSRGALAA